MGPRHYRCWPGHERNNWVCRRLLDAGLFPDVFFPCRSGRDPRFLLWIFYAADGGRYEHPTDYGTLGERDVARMIGMATHFKNSRTWEPRLTDDERNRAIG
jgi:hypothetical protein